MDSSPDSRCLVINNESHIFLLDWHTGEVISRHFSNGYATSGLAFDPTSTFVAGLSFADGGGVLNLWRLDPVERFVSRPVREEWPSRKYLPLIRRVVTFFSLVSQPGDQRPLPLKGVC